MKVEKLNAWLGFAGNVAILLGLIALAVELGQNTAAIRSQELSASDAQDRERQLVMLDPNVRALYVKSLYSPADLSIEELQGLTSLLSFRVNRLRRTYLASLDGIVRQADWESDVLEVPIFLGTPFGRIWWEIAKNDYAEYPAFISAIEGALESSSIIPDDEFLLDLRARAQRLGRSSNP